MPEKPLINFRGFILDGSMLTGQFMKGKTYEQIPKLHDSTEVINSKDGFKCLGVVTHDWHVLLLSVKYNNLYRMHCDDYATIMAHFYANEEGIAMDDTRQKYIYEKKREIFKELHHEYPRIYLN